MFGAVGRARGLRVVFWQHAPIVDRHWPDVWAAWTRPDVLVANSRFTASAPAFSDVPCHVIHCPVPASAPIALAERSAGRAALRTRDADVVVLMAARLEAWKGHRALIDAAKRFGRDVVKIWIAGGVQRPVERSYLEQLESDIAAGGLKPSVALLGERSDVSALMRLADIYCQPNLAAEPFGIAIAEAMRARLPCVVSDAGGAAELVDPACGILTAPGDVEALARAITQLAAHPARRDAMGRAGAARAARMTDPAGRLAELAAVLSAEPVHA
jgi:glycosyltransferase involved in cell wall biosynthesis